MELSLKPEVLSIPACRAKTLVVVAISLVFVGLGAWFLSHSPEEIAAHRRLNSPTLIYTIGIVVSVFFSLCAFAGIWRLASNKPSLELNTEGLVIFAMGPNLFVPWADIKHTSVFEIHMQKMLVLKVRDPEKYIEVGGSLRRKLARMSYEMCGSPVAISSNTVSLNFEELRKHIESYMKRFGK